MSIHDDQLAEHQKTAGAKSYVGPQEVTSTAIAPGAVVVGDITNNAVTAAKLATTCFGNGLSGGGGVAVGCTVDDSSVALVANQVCIKDQGVGPTHLALDTKGAGVVASAGVVCSVDVDGTTVEISGGALQLKSDGLSIAKTFVDARNHSLSIALPAFVANNTVVVGLMCVPAGHSVTINKAELSAFAIPVDADGTCLVRVVNYDSSALAEDEIVAAWNAEGLVAKTGTSLVVINAGGINVLEENDYLFLQLVNNSAGIDTPWAGAVLSIEFTTSS